jgi:hypothetical protein
MVVRDRFGKEVGTITDSLLSDFNEGKMPFGQQVDTILTIFKDSLLEDSEFEGLGHIQIVARVSDREAIEKLLDGRYLTGSVGATTDKAVCSVCKQDWTDTGACEHKPGGLYDGAKCFIIAGNLAYEEYSFVNVPADRHSRVLELNYNGVRDSIEIANDFRGRIYEVCLGFPQYDSVDKEEVNMSVKDERQDTSTVSEDTLPAEQSGDLAVNDEAGTEVQTPEPEVVEDAVEATPTEGKPEGSEEDVEEEAEVTDFLTELMDLEVLSDAQEEQLYEEMWKEAELAVEEGELDASELKDAKLSTEKRKKLASSTFCGPDRSFPVNDCAHVTAARRLIGRYKGPGDKSRILACVSRKAKALGCETSKKKDNAELEQQAPVAEENAQNKMLKALLEALNAVEVNAEDTLGDEERKTLGEVVKKLVALATKDSFVEVLVGEQLIEDPACGQALLDEIVKYEELIGDLRDQLSALRSEYNSLYKDMDALQDEATKKNELVRKAKESHLTTLATLRDKREEERNWSEFTDAALDAELDRVMKDVDMIKITDKLGDGMSREPAETVDSPVAIKDEQTQKGPSAEDLAKIEERFLALLWGKGQIAADEFIKKMQAEGKLPRDDEHQGGSE